MKRDLPYEGARWLWHPDAVRKNAYVNLIASFHLPEQYGRVDFHISADSNYVLWINGEWASDTQYADYGNYKVYDSADITALVTPSRNRLCILGYCQGEDSHTYRHGEAGVLYWITVDGAVAYVSDGSALCRIAPDYVSGEIEKITVQLSYGFHYDACKQDGWLGPDYVPSPDWTRADARTNTAELYPRPVAKLKTGAREKAIVLSQGVFSDAAPFIPAIGSRMQYAGMSFRGFSEMTGRDPASGLPAGLPCADGIRFACGDGGGLYLLIDLKEETVGFLELDLAFEQETEVLVGFGEHLDDLRVRTAVGGRQFAVRYKGKKGRQQFVHRPKRLGCRYLQLHVYAPAFTLYYAGIRPVFYPLEDRGRFRCDNGIHNKIYETCLKTLRLSVHEHYEDCPWREQALYAMDSRNQMLCGYYAFGEYDMPRASLRLLALGQRDDGLLEMCAPSRNCITIPAFSLCFITAAYEYALYSGDLAFVRELLPCIRRILRRFAGRLSEGDLLPCFTEPEYWNFYEWSDGLDGGVIHRTDAIPETYDAPLNGFFAIALQNYREICRLLDLPEERKWADAVFSRVRNGIDRRFWNAEKGAYCTFLSGGEQSHYSELTQSLMVCGRVADGEKRKILLEKLAYPDGGLVPVTLSCSIYKFEALLTEPARYAAHVFETIEKIWGDMLFAGATTFWETQKGAWDFACAGSLCHGWSAIPVYFYYSYALGIKPGRTGRAPAAGGLPNASGESLIRTSI